MLATCHLLAGVAIAASPENPSLTLPAAFFSHFVLDAMPHLESTTFSNQHKGVDYYPNKKEVFWAVVDVIVGIIIVIGLYLKTKNPFILFGAFLAVLPDLVLNIPSWYRLRRLPILKYLYRFHDKIHFNVKPKYWYWGIPLQLILLGAILWKFFGGF